MDILDKVLRILSSGGLSLIIKEEVATKKQEFWCSHPELLPSQWDQPKPPPAKMIGPCEHNQGCPVCGWGWGCSPDPCEEKRETEVRG